MMEASSPASSRYPWIVMLVGVPEAMVEKCTTAASPIPVMRVEDGRGALEQILSLRPAVVVVGPEVDFETLQSIRIRASATRGALVDLPVAPSARELEEQIRAGLARAEVARAAVRSRRT